MDYASLVVANENRRFIDLFLYRKHICIIKHE